MGTSCPANASCRHVVAAPGSRAARGAVKRLNDPASEVAVGACGVDFLEFIRGEAPQYISNIGHDRFPSRTLPVRTDAWIALLLDRPVA